MLSMRSNRVVELRMDLCSKLMVDRRMRHRRVIPLKHHRRMDFSIHSSRRYHPVVINRKDSDRELNVVHRFPFKFIRRTSYLSLLRSALRSNRCYPINNLDSVNGVDCIHISRNIATITVSTSRRVKAMLVLVLVR